MTSVRSWYNLVIQGYTASLPPALPQHSHEAKTLASGPVHAER